MSIELTNSFMLGRDGESGGAVYCHDCDLLIEELIANHRRGKHVEIFSFELDSCDAGKRIAALGGDDAHRLLKRVIDRALSTRYREGIERLHMGLAKKLIGSAGVLSEDDLKSLLLWHKTELERWGDRIADSPELWRHWNFFPSLLECLDEMTFACQLTAPMIEALFAIPDEAIPDQLLLERWRNLLNRIRSTMSAGVLDDRVAIRGTLDRHELDPLIDEFIANHRRGKHVAIFSLEMNSCEAGNRIVALNFDEAHRLLTRVVERALSARYREGVERLHMGLAKALLRPGLDLSEGVVKSLVLWYQAELTRWGGVIRENPGEWKHWNFLPSLVGCIEAMAAKSSLPESIRDTLFGVPDKTIPDHDLLERWWCLWGRKLPPVQGTDVWACRVLEEIKAMPEKEAQPWIALLEHCASATSGKPSTKWLKNARVHVCRIGCAAAYRRLAAWFALTDRPRLQEYMGGWSRETVQLDELNSDVLRGMVWCSVLLDEVDAPAMLIDLAMASYRKCPGVGPRAIKIGNAAVWALANLEGLSGVPALAVLKARLKPESARKAVDAALAAVADREGMSADDLEELAVPGYGMESVGVRTETFGDFSVELKVVDGGQTETLWRRKDGTTQKSVPSVLKQNFAEDLKELKQAEQGIRMQLPAQKDRLERLFIQRKSWPFHVWRDRYLDHPLVGVLARRLIWSFEQDGVCRSGFFVDGALCGRDGSAIEIDSDNTLVRLWHPIDSAPAEVLAWRLWLEERRITQPLKQAHREIYLLTDAERSTRIYSNRFAGHILKQHQFHALCAARQWRHRLHVSMEEDAECQASRTMPQWGLRAEYWVEGIGEFGADTNEVGTFLNVATDQIRFYRIGGAEREGGDDALPLADIPARVFSEVMRDVDLFVGVASVGNDPGWRDGGAEGRRNYWLEYSFGDLAETAKTRRDVLSRLLPRLRIGGRCTLTDRFLEVQGDIRRYRIHLGSGNILMAPNDQYLCIVPDRHETGERIFLPFEGDTLFSIILSKAIMLADDKSITDPTIVSQILAS